MTDPFNGKVAVITGAASGIGEALAKGFAARGTRLLLADVHAGRLDAVAAALRAGGADCRTRVCDVALPESVQALADEAARDMGGADIVINNAGVALVAPALSVPLADTHWLMAINFWGVVHGCRAFAPQLQARDGGVLVNISSIFAMISMPTQSIYNASKAAVRGYSDALREELRAPAPGLHPVHVLCVHPGGIRTRIAEHARLGDISGLADSAQEMQRNFEDAARTSPSQAAAAIIRAIERRRTRLLIGPDAVVADAIYRLFPARASAWMSALGRRHRERMKRKAT
ncbi:MAG: SDR family NAD(P)-dependent oxidoreductase [Burkholderiaceae bacterium]|nr:SDR family NAD(P)-dependent oxidoreductase [Burkholderiaceae bacterium]